MSRAIVGLGVVGAIVAAVSCGDSKPGSSGECPIGTFRPAGLAECVIPADQDFVSDTRCSTQAMVAACVSTSGLRPYFATSTHCAPGYEFQMGSCLGGGFGTGTATGVGGFATVSTGAAGFEGGFAGSADGLGGLGGFNPGGAGGNAGGSFGGAGGLAGDGADASQPMPDATSDVASVDARDASVEGASDVSGGESGG